MTRKRVFVSYHHSTDRHYKNLLLAWDKNKRFDFRMRDCSADLSVRSNNPESLKRVLSMKINKGTHFLVIIGPDTHDCEWVKWEIRKARELEKNIIAVKTNPHNRPPAELYRAGAEWINHFRMRPICEALEKTPTYE